mmetsp:Transcript_10582/g.17275  ORF Transcript_10582/g.17275 Transcript_10582/m.17275 type:complete len:458 (-) Transcript_10582:1304-2677(-)|eukprot:CAMPEP_0203765978 /NCGR_PEP_ID=MMETSP0099_2-20121227/160_1 /ASSEMBLY_ACC=CAM_ASM_000209 /TAXON_ID=96639 /ORGANISM=" , Strain NY0313808BC1" /LENGTH=457 /DNA_ID=CAMNT_0050662273 /DNA_START=306 /DNA_END=1679 /DNA_ORIENTATION=+
MEGLEFGFSASGWLMLYQLGVAHALQRHNISEANGAKFIGASGGAAVSAALTLDIDAKLLSDFMLRCCADYHKAPLKNLFKMRKYAQSCVERCMHSKTFEEQGVKSRQLNIAITMLPQCKGEIINEFHSNEEYLEILMASCTATPFAGFPIQLTSKHKGLDGKFAFDGGVANMIPTLSENTITVCPLYCFDADIKPSRYIPIWWALLPPSVPELRELFWLGAKDGMTWMHKNGYGSFRLSESRFRAKMDENNVARIKPCLPRIKVTPHSSNDTIAAPVNPHTLQLSKPRSLSIDSFSTTKIERIILSDAAKSGVEMSLARQQVNKIGDSAFMSVAITCVKPIAITAVYAELWSKAVLSASSAAFAVVEENRRKKKPKQNTGWLSMRRWVHQEMIGNAHESWNATSRYVSTALEPKGWLKHIPIVGQKLVGDEADCAVHEKLHKSSAVYRYMQQLSIM